MGYIQGVHVDQGVVTQNGAMVVPDACPELYRRKVGDGQREHRLAPCVSRFLVQGFGRRVGHDHLCNHEFGTTNCANFTNLWGEGKGRLCAEKGVKQLRRPGLVESFWV